MFNPNFNYAPGYSTFQSVTPTNIPPPPMRHGPPYNQLPPFNDQQFLKTFENRIPRVNPKQKVKSNIGDMRDRLRDLTLKINYIKEKELLLETGIDSLPDKEWTETLTELEHSKKYISQSLMNIVVSVDLLKKLVAKRSVKRARLRRLRSEKKREKQDKRKELEETSRKNEENLQKIVDDIHKLDMEEEAKLKADIVLKEVLRKKHDAKKCLVKLEALLKLRKARQNTAKGRGEIISEADASIFCKNIEKLKSLWIQRQAVYEKEESELRMKLAQDTPQADEGTDAEKTVIEGLQQWTEVMFGGVNPQADFNGDIGQFVVVRSQWDRFIDSKGSPMPVGWVLPS